MESIQKSTVVILHENTIMQYDWGSTSSACTINQLRKQKHPRWAELWLGTHKNGPSKLNSETTLSQYLQSKGKQSQLPFLFKILSIQKCLSIQLHPNKQQAEHLYKNKPNIYPDQNQKPEMFYTLTQFQCFFGFINEQKLHELMQISPFSELNSKNTNNLKQIITEILQISQYEIDEKLQKLLQNIKKVDVQRSVLMKRLYDEFPKDIGLMISCLLNYMVIPAGRCFAIDAGIPHAYIKGQCLQIMKNSDNVVRLGLTPKIKDTQTMLEIMNSTPGISGEQVFKEEDGTYSWNHLRIRETFIADNNNQTNIYLSEDAIGIVFQGNVQPQSQNGEIILKEGQVFYATKGQLNFKQGSAKIYFGSFY